MLCTFRFNKQNCLNKNKYWNFKPHLLWQPPFRSVYTTTSPYTIFNLIFVFYQNINMHGIASIARGPKLFEGSYDVIEFSLAAMNFMIVKRETPYIPNIKIEESNFVIVQVTPTFIPINDCGARDREVIITLRPHLPIRSKPINIDMYIAKQSKLIDEICVVGDKGFKDCGVVFQPGHPVGQPMRFKLMTNCATGDKSATLNTNYELQHLYSENINEFWANHRFPKIKVGLSLITLL